MAAKSKVQGIVMCSVCSGQKINQCHWVRPVRFQHYSYASKPKNPHETAVKSMVFISKTAHLMKLLLILSPSTKYIFFRSSALCCLQLARSLHAAFNVSC